MKRVMTLANRLFDIADKYSPFLDKICACMLALMPILQHYRGIVDNAATTLLALLVPYLALRVLPRLKNIKTSQISLIIVLIIFYLYRVVDHGTSFVEIAQACIVIGYLVSIVLGCIDVNAVAKAAINIASIAGLCLVVQYFCFYVLGFHLQLVPISLLLKEADMWVLGAQTGLVGVTGRISDIYRPSAFFLEPSHLFMYSFAVLFISLFKNKLEVRDKIHAALITLGMVLCTSGMGIFVAAGTWFAFVLLRDPEDGSFRIGNVFKKRTWVQVGKLMIVYALIVAFVPFIRDSVLRIFFGSEFVANLGGGKNDKMTLPGDLVLPENIQIEDGEITSTAISGRTESAILEIKKMTIIQWVFGVSDSTAGLGINMPGFMATLYKYGMIGVVLSYEFYLRALLKLDIAYFLTSGILLVVSLFSAHTHGTFFMLFYIMLLMRGHNTHTGEWTKEIKWFFSELKNRLFKK